IIWWSLSRNPATLNLDRILSGDRNSTPLLVPSPQATEENEATPRLLPPVSPTISPAEIPPTQLQRPSQRFPVVVPLPNTTASSSPTQVVTPINFVDVPQDYWARPYIDALSARRIVNGYAGDYFRPNQTITRTEFAALVQAAFDNQPIPGTTEYKDIPTNFWGVPAINSATRTGFLTGYPGDIFRPIQEIPRVQVLVALASGLNLTPSTSPEQVLQAYGDATEIPNYAREKVAAATNAGLVANYPDLNSLAPNRNATRAEVTAMIYQSLVRNGSLKPINSPYVGNTK
nr:S-layer homology domain-containing protein [Tatlockia sp.]